MTSYDANMATLDWIEEIGGGYVWEREIFAITLLDIAITDTQSERIGSLVGVDQIMVNITDLTEVGLLRLAAIEGLRSLVVEGRPLQSSEKDQLAAMAPAAEIVEVD